MTSNNRTAWTEGMFLGPQHFQQHDRFLLNTISAVCAASDSYPYGLLDLDIDESALSEGKFVVSKASGIFPDGTLFNLPKDGDLPAPIEIGAGTQNAIVHLAIPYVSSSDKDAIPVQDNSTDDKNSLAQYIVRPEIVADRQSKDSNSEETVFTARLWTRLLLTTDNEPSYFTIPIARIIEKRDDKSIVLDTSFFCCAMAVQASAQLVQHCKEINDLMRQRASQLAEKMGQATTSDTSQFTQFMLLQTINRVLPLMQHLQTLSALHPERLYRELSQLIGELATVTDKSRQCPELPAYHHRDQHESFIPQFKMLRDQLNWTQDTKVDRIEVVHVKAGVYTATVADLHLFNNARFILAVKAPVAPVELARRFPKQITISSKTQLKELVKAQAQGVELQNLVNVPNSINAYESDVYFEMQRNAPLWDEIAISGVIAMHIAGSYADLNMQLWTIAR